jgi:aminopeptidase N
MRSRLAVAIVLALGLPQAAESLAQAATAPSGPAAGAAPRVVSASATARPTTPTQLPNDVRPLAYTLEITPHAARLAFDAEAGIDIEVLRPTRAITLNALDLDFQRVELHAGGKLVEATKDIGIDADAQTATFRFASALAPGKYRLELRYSGKVGTQANGLFAIDYENEQGKKRALFTQFENSDARRMLPSWDEPAFRTPIKLTVIVQGNDMAVSNMPMIGRKPIGEGRSRVEFGLSPAMSTYLLFLAVGELERDTMISGRTELGVVTQRGSIEKAQYALKSSDDILQALNGYFGVPYPLPKLDNVASPGRSQFFSAMENWGAIFTFENTLLLDPMISTVGDRKRIFTVAAHEIAHQWFGNLVTMHWWDDLWLNEGFASWMEGRITEVLHPEWNTVLSRVEVRESAMARDALATTHPVVTPIETVEQASQAFDAITYSKGEAVVAMLEDYVGAAAWREGVRRYINKHAYSNTVSDDLWREVEAAAGKPILELAHQFTLQPGVPMIRVESARCVGGATEAVLVQGEFTKDRPDKAPLAWNVPVIARTSGSEAEARALVTGGRATLQVPGCGALLLNAGQTGYYRTQYAPAQLAALRRDFGTLRAIDQLGLLNDNWALGMAGQQSAAAALDLAAAAPTDAAPEVWSEIAGQIAVLDGRFEDLPGQARLRQFGIARLAPVLARVGWTPRREESASETLLRTRLLGTLGALGDADVIAEARRRFAARDTDPTALPAALRRTVLGIVARHADAATWDTLHALAKAEKVALVRDEYYGLLAGSADPALAKRALALAITDEPGATNTAAMIALVSVQHPDLAFDFALANMGAVDARVDSTSRSRYYPGLGSNSHDPAMVAKLRAYADKHVAAGSRRATDTAIASVEDTLAVRRKRLPEIEAWLRRQD